MDSDEKDESESQPAPIIPQVVALGLNHSLCICRGIGMSAPSERKLKDKSNDQAISNLSVLSWGKVAFNCLGQGVDISTLESPKVIPFFDGKNVYQVSCGDYHSAVLVLPTRYTKDSGGTVYTFGLGNCGRLGYHIDEKTELLDKKSNNEWVDRTSWCSHVPNPVGISVGLKNTVTTVACGANHTLVTTNFGDLYAWGVGSHGVLGTGNCMNQFIPVKVDFRCQDDVFVSKCSAGSRHSLALDKNGRVWSWGYGGNGRLGLGHMRSCYSPMIIKLFDDYEIVEISCGDSHNACIDRFGNLYTWGSAKGGKLGHGKLQCDLLEPTIVEALIGIQITMVSCSTGNTLALSHSGTIYHWGCILGFTQPASGILPNLVYVPQELGGIGHNNIYVTAGPYSCASVTVFGDLLTWGVGSCYRLGHDNMTDYVEPKFVSELRNRVYIDGILKGHRQTKKETSLEGKPLTSSYDEKRIQQISIGMAHGALLTCNGTVYTWGVNNGNGYNVTKEPLEDYAEPCLLSHFSTKIKKIACGYNHTLLVTSHGLAFSWGCNENGQLGFGDLRPRIFPEHIYTLENVINVFAGANNSCCITSINHDDFINDEVGSLWVFGSASGGKLGLGNDSAISVMTPKRINDISGVYKVALGPNHTLALLQDGTLFSCGAGFGGMLGNGDTRSVSTFSGIPTDLKFIDIAVGASHSLGISMEHDLYGWGKGKYLSLKEDDVLIPTMITTILSPTGIAKVSAVAAAGNHSLVITDNGELIAWGDNKSGQLGVQLMKGNRAVNDFIEVPAIVSLDSPVLSVATSRFHSACTNTKGDAFSWGLASDARLGIGSTKNKIVYKPTPIVTIGMVGDIMETSCADINLDNNMTYASMVEAFLDEQYICKDGSIVDWKNLQFLLKSEERTNWEVCLKIFEDDLVKCLKKHLDYILTMQDSQMCIESLQFKLQIAMKGFVSRVGGSKPSIGRVIKTIDRFTEFTPQLENIAEIVFLQPAYFVRLCLFSDNIDTVKDMIINVYKRLDVKRIHNQFMSLLFTLLREEILFFFDPLNQLAACSSPFSRIFRAYATTKFVLVFNAHKFYSLENPESVIVYMQRNREHFSIPSTPSDVSKADFSDGIRNFAKFIVHFKKIVKELYIPDNIKLLFKRMRNILKERIPTGLAPPSVPLEDVSIYPLIPIFVYAIIQPFFQNANTISELCGFGKNDDQFILENFSVVSQYLEYIVNPALKMPTTESKLENATRNIYRTLSNLFLEFIKTILFVEDNYNVEMTLETFKSHFDTERTNVFVPSHLMAKFVNLCRMHENYLNLSAHDPLVKIISDLKMTDKKSDKSSGIFREDLIKKLEDSGKFLSVKIEHRFIIYDRNMSLCTFSNVFLPQRLAYRQATYSEDCIKLISLIVRYTPYGKYDPPRIIQNALVSLKVMDTASGDLQSLRSQFENMLDFYTNLRQPDYVSAKRAKDAIKVLDMLDAKRIKPTLLASVILKKVLERHHHRLYLLQIYRRQDEIEKCKRNFQTSFRYRMEYLKKCIEHANIAYVEPSLIRAASDKKVKLFSFRVARKAADIPNIYSLSFPCKTLYKSGALILNKAADGSSTDWNIIIFSSNKNEECIINLESKSKGRKGHKMIETWRIPLDTLCKCSTLPSENFREIFVSQSYPHGIFRIKTSFLLEVFMQLMESSI